MKALSRTVVKVELPITLKIILHEPQANVNLLYGFLYLLNEISLAKCPRWYGSLQALE